MGALDLFKELVFGTYSYTNKKGAKWFLHSKVVATVETRDGNTESKIYYFSHDSKDSISMPEGFFVVESQKTAMPVLKKRPA